MLFAVIHMYMVFREDIMSGESVIGTMINGIRMWKREPKDLIGRRRQLVLAVSRAPRFKAAGPVRAPRRSRRRRAGRRCPGEFLETRFLKPLAITQTELALALGVSRRRVNELINGRRAITPDTAVRLAVFFGNDAAFWMHLQVAWDMHAAVRQTRALTGRK